MLVKRGLLQIILSDFRARVIDSIDIPYVRLQDKDELIHLLLRAYRDLDARNDRRIVAISVSSVGPVDINRGVILNPPDFFGLSNIEITKALGRETNLPAYLINDANAGALAEKLYGYGQELSNFVYLHIMNGIGAGAVLDDKLYEGDTGQSCEFGHTSISFIGPKCSCGNTGCLDLFAILGKMNEHAGSLAYLYPDSALFQKENLTWNDYIAYANRKDALAMIVVSQFCDYISYALTNLLNLLDTNHVIIGYDSETQGSFVEDAISSRVNKSVLFSSYKHIEVKHSSFGGQGPLIGSVAVVTDKIFNRDIADGDPDEPLFLFIRSRESGV